MIRTLLFLTFISSQSFTSPGCMDNSWHLARRFDNKEYHIVSRKVGKDETFCPCECRKLSLIRGQCLDCGHKHDIQPWIIVRSPKVR